MVLGIEFDKELMTCETFYLILNITYLIIIKTIKIHSNKPFRYHKRLNKQTKNIERKVQYSTKRTNLNEATC